MSLANTLIKVAIGVAVAKGVSTLVKGSGSAGTTSSAGRPGGIEDIMEGIGNRKAGGGRRYDPQDDQSNESEGGLGDLLGQLTGQSAGKPGGRNGNRRRRNNAPKGGLEDMLADSGQGGGQSGGQSGGLGDLLGQLTGTGSGRAGGGGAGSGGRSTQDSGGGGLGDLLGQLTGAQRGATGGGATGGLGDLLGQLTGGGTTSRSAPQGGGGLGDLLGAVLGGLGGAAMGGETAGGDTPGGASSRQQDLAAALILRAMVAAVKADGELDADEKRKLTEQADGASREEIAFITAELERRTDVDELASQVPEGMEAQVYIMSLMAIDLDNQREAQHLDQLAKALSLDPREVNALHDRAGVARLYN